MPLIVQQFSGLSEIWSSSDCASSQSSGNYGVSWRSVPMKAQNLSLYIYIFIFLKQSLITQTQLHILTSGFSLPNDRPLTQNEREISLISSTPRLSSLGFLIRNVTFVCHTSEDFLFPFQLPLNSAGSRHLTSPCRQCLQLHTCCTDYRKRKLSAIFGNKKHTEPTHLDSINKATLRWGGKVVCVNLIWSLCARTKEAGLLSHGPTHPFLRSPVCREQLEPSTFGELHIPELSPTKSFLPQEATRATQKWACALSSFLTTSGNSRLRALVLSWHPLHWAPSSPDSKKPRPQQRGRGLLAPAQSCCHTATRHQASSGCGHSSLCFQPKICRMERPNCCLHKNYSSSGLSLGL